MKNFKAPVPVEWSNQLVLLTAQLAEYYECDVNNIKKNFNANRDRFVEGKHYFRLEGEALKQFKDCSAENGLKISPMTRTLYLWTASGIFLHCKMINTPQAWNLFSQIGEELSMENHPILENVIFSKIKPPEAKPNLAYVYAIEFDNGFVKIGMSNDVDTRKGSIRRKLSFKDVRTYHTDFIARRKALQIENLCHDFFHDRLAYRREYFRIPFEEACKVINAFVEVVACIPQVSNFERAEKIFALVNAMPEGHERNQMLLTFTKLIADEKFS